MPPKPKTSLSAAVKTTAAAETERTEQRIEEAASANRPPRAPRAPSRVGTRQLGAYFPEDVHRAWKVLAAERDATSQSLLAEAINDLFQKYGRPRIAEESRLR